MIAPQSGQATRWRQLLGSPAMRAWGATFATVAVTLVVAPRYGIWLLLAAAIALAARHLAAGVLLWVGVCGTLTMPLLIVRSSTIPLGSAYLSALLVLWLGSCVRRQRRPVATGPLTVPLLALAAAALLSCVAGVVFYDATVPGVHRFFLMQIYATALVVLPIGAAFLVADQLGTPERLRWVRAIVIGVGVSILCADLVPFGILRTTAWSPLLVAHALTLLFATLLCDSPHAFWQRALCAGLIVYGLVRLVALPFFFAETQWLSGWIMLTVALACSIFLWSWRLFFAISLPIGAAAAFLTMPWIHRVVMIAQAEGDLHRVRIWEDALRLTLLRPLLGVGPGNYLDYAMRYAHTRILFGSAHGNYQQIAAEMGVIGLAATLWVIATAFVIGWRLVRVLHDALLRALALGITASLAGQVVASVIGDYLIPAYHNGGHTNVCTTVYTWVLIGVLIAAHRLAGPAWKEHLRGAQMGTDS